MNSAMSGVTRLGSIEGQKSSEKTREATASSGDHNGGPNADGGTPRSLGHERWRVGDNCEHGQRQ